MCLQLGGQLLVEQPFGGAHPQPALAIGGKAYAQCLQFVQQGGERGIRRGGVAHAVIVVGLRSRQ